MELTKEQELMQRIINEAWENETFKQELVADPVSAIEKLTGNKSNLPAGKQLVVRDKTDESTIYINIPPKVYMEDVELNEEQLEVVAGGGAPNIDLGRLNEMLRYFIGVGGEDGMA